MQTVNKIVNGDCLIELPKLDAESVNFILTDPPYLINYKSRDGRMIRNDDNDRWLQPAFAEMYRVLERNAFCVSFYGWPAADRFIAAYRSAGFRVVGHLVFAKRYTSSSRYLRYQHECAHLLAKGCPPMPEKPIGDVLHWSYSGNKLHPTQKPVSVLMPLVETFSREGGTVLDPFAGSGSSLVAATKLDRDFYGIELDPTYYAAACSRLADPEEHELRV